MTVGTPQYMQALKHANVIRVGRAELKREILRGDCSVTKVLDPAASVPAVAETMTVSQLLCAQRRWGSTRARKLLGEVGIREAKRVGDLTVRQRRAIIDALADNEAHQARKREFLAA